VVSDQARGARLGVLLVDLDLAARTSDSVAIRRIAADVAALSEAIVGAGPLLAPYTSLASGGASNSSARAEVEDALAGLAGRDWAIAGGTAETVRAAAASGDSSAVAVLCARSAQLRRSLTTASGTPEAAIRDSLAQALNERPCSSDRLNALATAFLGLITR
jgi:hypothetical protein